MVRRAGATALSVIVAAALGWSAWKDMPHSWRVMRSQHDAFSGYTQAQRDRAFGTSIPMPMEIIDYWRSGLRRGDRYFVQMPPLPFSTIADKRYVARSIAHVYLLPAIEARDLSHADVVLSWEADPGLLHLKFSEQHRAGLQLIFVSRIARDS